MRYDYAELRDSSIGHAALETCVAALCEPMRPAMLMKMFRLKLTPVEERD